MENNTKLDQDYLKDLTGSQISVLKKFRERLQDVLRPGYDDYFLLRFLRARNFKLDKAEKMIREHLKLRTKVCADSMATDYTIPEVVDKYFPYSHLGFDKDGNFIAAYLSGKVDVKGFCKSLTWEEQVKYSIFHLDRALRTMAEENKKTGKKGRKMVEIHDLIGLQLGFLTDTAVAKNLIDLMLLVQTNYPEILKRVYFLNAPSYFHTWFNVAKKFIDPEPLSKIRIYGADGWQQDMFEHIDPCLIPAFLGGARTDPEGGEQCLSLFVRETKIPLSYYLKNRKASTDPEMTKVMVGERTYYNHSINVKEINTVIRWAFRTIDNNINFALYFAPSVTKKVPECLTEEEIEKLFSYQMASSKDGHTILMPLERVSSQLIPEHGELRCNKVGTYFLHFDNTYSWLTPKELHYKVEVFPPFESSIEHVTSEVYNTRL